MSSNPKQSNNPQAKYANRGRSLSRQILGPDMDLVNKYASKYNPSQNGHIKRTQTYSAIPNGSYGGYGGHGSTYNPYQSGGGAYHGYGSGSGSSTGSYSNNTSSKNKKSRRTPSNLIQANNTTAWDPNAVTSQQQDMSQAMSAMVDSYQNRIVEQAAFLDEIQDDAEEDENFAKKENADDWSVKE
eukprot:224113_1